MTRHTADQCSVDSYRVSCESLCS